MENRTILIIDGDQDEQIITSECLNLLHFSEFTCFSNGRDALDFLLTTEIKPFLIFSEIEMEVMDGLELRKVINETDFLRKRNIPFIFLTKAGNHDDIQKAYDLGVNGFFVKPDSFWDLKEVVKMIVSYWTSSETPNKN